MDLSWPKDGISSSNENLMLAALFSAIGSRHQTAPSCLLCFCLLTAKYNAASALSVQSRSLVGARECCIRNIHSHSSCGWLCKCGVAFCMNRLMTAFSARRCDFLLAKDGTSFHVATPCPRNHTVCPSLICRFSAPSSCATDRIV